MNFDDYLEEEGFVFDDEFDDEPLDEEDEEELEPEGNTN